jgi:hypothetical protein
MVNPATQRIILRRRERINPMPTRDKGKPLQQNTQTMGNTNVGNQNQNANNNGLAMIGKEQ